MPYKVRFFFSVLCLSFPLFSAVLPSPEEEISVASLPRPFTRPWRDSLLSWKNTLDTKGALHPCRLIPIVEALEDQHHAIARSYNTLRRSLVSPAGLLREDMCWSSSLKSGFCGGRDLKSQCDLYTRIWLSFEMIDKKLTDLEKSIRRSSDNPIDSVTKESRIETPNFSSVPLPVVQESVPKVELNPRLSLASQKIRTNREHRKHNPLSRPKPKDTPQNPTKHSLSSHLELKDLDPKNSPYNPLGHPDLKDIRQKDPKHSSADHTRFKELGHKDKIAQ